MSMVGVVVCFYFFVYRVVEWLSMLMVVVYIFLSGVYIFLSGECHRLWMMSGVYIFFGGHVVANGMLLWSVYIYIYI